jgi:ankyrin repeat protein
MLQGGNGPNRGETPLHVVARRGHTQLVKPLLDAGAEIGARNAQHETPLHQAVARPSSDTQLVESLLDAGAEIGARNAQHETPLHLAVCYGFLDAVKVLIKRGADVNAISTSVRGAP